MCLTWLGKTKHYLYILLGRREGMVGRRRVCFRRSKSSSRTCQTKQVVHVVSDDLKDVFNGLVPTGITAKCLRTYNHENM